MLRRFLRIVRIAVLLIVAVGIAAASVGAAVALLDHLRTSLRVRS
jgi:hypothetical protein